MSKVCFGFEAHQPFRLNPDFSPGNGKKVKRTQEDYFSPKNKEILERVAEKCYIPATGVVLESLDEGFKCAFSISGTLIEQLVRWSPDTLDLFRQVAAHRNAEILAQTYYHSVSSLFDDLQEFEEQVILHVELMKDTFGIRPQVIENTEFLFNKDIAASARDMGFKAIYTEGVERILGWRSPNYVYTCNGIKLLLRNYSLSDDIAFRFNNIEWDQYPLTADKFAGWLAAAPGDCTNLFVDYETFGEHHWKESGIIEFLKWLPQECANNGVEFVKPSEVADMDAREDLSIEETISWADIEKDASAWKGNAIQNSAIKAIQMAKTFIPDLRMWRYLQTSDHFYYMASKFGSCAEVHHYFSPHACSTFDSFNNYMMVLSDIERRGAFKMKYRQAVMTLRSLPPESAFNFYNTSAYTGFSAYSIDDLGDVLNFVPGDSVDYHISKNDFGKWISEVLGDKKLAVAVESCKNRIELLETINAKRDELWERLK